MDRIEQEVPRDDFEVEAADLSGSGRPLRRWQPWPSHEHVKHWLRSRWRLTSAACVLLAVLLSLAGAIPAPPSPAPPSLVVINVAQGSLACVNNFAWSPDGRRLALLDYKQNCPQGSNSYQPGLLSIYSADSGRLIRQIHPDGPILQAIQKFSTSQSSASGAVSSPMIIYNTLLWSPRVQRLAFGFSAQVFSPIPSSWQPLTGLLLMDEDGGHPQVLLQPDRYQSYNEWDLQRGTLLPAMSPVMQNFPSFFCCSNFPIAPAYHWTTNGALLPEGQTSLDTPPAPSLGPIGNPSGDASFTIWQPGMAELTTHVPNQPDEMPGIYTWGSSFAAWSPDGRYLLNRLSLTGRMQPAGIAPPRHQTLVDFGANQTPLLAVRDLALQRMLGLLAQASSGDLALAWRPGGRVLAAYGFVVNNERSVNLYDCANGRLITSLSPFVPGSPASLGGVASLRWSPNGSRLLYLNGETAVVWQFAGG
jgi:hypothetical protein